MTATICSCISLITIFLSCMHFMQGQVLPITESSGHQLIWVCVSCWLCLKKVVGNQTSNSHAKVVFYIGHHTKVVRMLSLSMHVHVVLNANWDRVQQMQTNIDKPMSFIFQSHALFKLKCLNDSPHSVTTLGWNDSLWWTWRSSRWDQIEAVSLGSQEGLGFRLWAMDDGNEFWVFH